MIRTPRSREDIQLKQYVIAQIAQVNPNGFGTVEHDVPRDVREALDGMSEEEGRVLVGAVLGFLGCEG